MATERSCAVQRGHTAVLAFRVNNIVGGVLCVLYLDDALFYIVVLNDIEL